MYISLHVNYLSFLSDIDDTWRFPNKFSNNTQISNFMNILSVGAKFFVILQRYLVPDLNDVCSLFSFWFNASNLKRLELGTWAFLVRQTIDLLILWGYDVICISAVTDMVLIRPYILYRTKLRYGLFTEKLIYKNNKNIIEIVT